MTNLAVVVVDARGPARRLETGCRRRRHTHVAERTKAVVVRAIGSAREAHERHVERLAALSLRTLIVRLAVETAAAELLVVADRVHGARHAGDTRALLSDSIDA